MSRRRREEEGQEEKPAGSAPRRRRRDERTLRVRRQDRARLVAHAPDAQLLHQVGQARD